VNAEITSANQSFNFLRNSGNFLSLILNNINSCVLLLDKDVRLRAFNDSLKTIFSNKKDEHLLYMRCGEAIGCAYQINEQKDCGETSQCCNCDIRIAALTSYMNNVPVYKERVIRPFMNYNNEIEDKTLQFSTRLFEFEQEKYIVMIIEDITNFAKITQ
jgi:hypothetical protein